MEILKLPVGIENFEDIRRSGFYYIDKTMLIEQTLNNWSKVTLFTRPRRFGKTLGMSMLRSFFEIGTDKSLFDGLYISQDKSLCDEHMGKYPVIFISLKDVEGLSYDEAFQVFSRIIGNEISKFSFLAESNKLTVLEKEQFKGLLHIEKGKLIFDKDTFTASLKLLSQLLYKHYGQKVVILIDEYDVPLDKAYQNGYYHEMVSLIRGLFGQALKTNDYLQFAILTGCLRISKESIFTGLNNFEVVSIMDSMYDECFGFTDKEVQEILKYFDLSEHYADVKEWYDGFIFGSLHDIYNPWSITNYLDTRKLQPFWASTSSNSLVSRLIQTASGEIKEKMEELLQGRQIVVTFDEQIVFDQLGRNENAIWSLLLASGYLKAEQVEYRGLIREPWYHLSITNLETASMFSGMFKGWFGMTQTSYNRFVKALFQGDVDAMNYYMNEVSVATFSFFDTGKEGGKDSEPERFYHGFVLGLLADQAEQYEIRSNRESGFGRYDVMMIPKNQKNTDSLAFILEFKVRNPGKEKSLEETVQTALEQIETKQYDAELLARGIEKERIRHYGFAFDGKQVLIG